MTRMRSKSTVLCVFAIALLSTSASGCGNFRTSHGEPVGDGVFVNPATAASSPVLDTAAP